MSYLDASLLISERVADLLGQMTLDEKLAQIYSCWMRDLLDKHHSLSPEKMKRQFVNGMGQITRAGGSSTFPPATLAKTVNALQRYLVKETRLGIPAIVHEECCLGFMALGGSAFPQMIGLASTFQPELAEKMTTVIRKQMRAVGAHQGLAPVLDVARDARWGRVEETFGEDPILVSQFGLAYVKGLQGNSLNEGGVMATGKHFVGHSLSQGGLNCAPAQIGKHELWDIYLAPFQAAVRDAGLHSIMNAYPELDGEVVAASRAILTDLLRERLGFDGLLVSDYEAILMIHNYQKMATDKSSAAVLALQAGIDVELPVAVCYTDPLKEAIQKGEVSIDLVDIAVSRHLQKKFELGLFENPYVDENHVLEVFETPDQRALANQIACQSMVLLTNNGILPLKKTSGTLAVIGPNADNSRNLLGDYSYPAMLSYMHSIAIPGSALAAIDPADLVPQEVKVPTILDSIKAVVPKVNVLHARGCGTLDEDRSGFDEAVRIAQQADVVVLVLGERSGMTPDCSTGETRDSVDLRLPGVQHALAEAIFKTEKPVVVVLVNGRPLAIPELVQKADAILEAWLPGEEGGGAVAKTLFGETNPGGRLPITFPRHVGQLPIFYNQKPSGGKSNWYTDYVTAQAKPLFPFGHGLSYTTFEYSALALSRERATSGETIDINIKVENTGSAMGDEVVQLYICDEYACSPRPIKELKGFVRLTLQPGETRCVTFHLAVDQLAFYDGNLDLVVESGRTQVMVGSSSEDIRLRDSFDIVGAKKEKVKDRIFICPVEVK
jgi:beta-glucosidase